METEMGFFAIKESSSETLIRSSYTRRGKLTVLGKSITIHQSSWALKYKYQSDAR